MTHRDMLPRREAWPGARISRISVVSGEPDRELDRIAQTISGAIRVAGCDELATSLEDLLAGSAAPAATAPSTLDLIGHSTGSGLLRLGDWVIDPGRSEVSAWFHRLAARDVLARLGIRAIRLLGCATAASEAGRAALRALAALAGVEVLGTRELLWAGLYDEHGFRPDWEFLLVSARELQGPGGATNDGARARPGPHTLVLDQLPAASLGGAVAPWPRRVVPAATAQEILALIHGDQGAPMPGAVEPPLCELAIPSARPGDGERYHLAHVLLGGAFLRFFPDGSGGPGLAFPVRDARQLLRIVEGLALSGRERSILSRC